MLLPLTPTRARRPPFDTLVVVDPETNEIKGQIAESWEQPDDQTYVFKIRQGIKFHDGSDLTAEDVKFSLDRAINSAAVSYIVDFIDSVTVDDEYTVTVKTKAPYAPALRNLAIPFAAIVPISAKTGEGLDALMDELEGFAEEGPHLFPDDVFTDQPEKQLCAEIIREKLLWCLEREVPHGTAVVVTRFEEREDGIVELDATIYCEKASHKGIIIGKQGAMLKKIGEMARRDMETLLDTKVFLQTWVKVKENWRDSQPLLRNFGFTEQ